jgi:hypothetical protein
MPEPNEATEFAIEYGLVEGHDRADGYFTHVGTLSVLADSILIEGRCQPGLNTAEVISLFVPYIGHGLCAQVHSESEPDHSADRFLFEPDGRQVCFEPRCWVIWFEIRDDLWVVVRTRRSGELDKPPRQRFYDMLDQLLPLFASRLQPVRLRWRLSKSFKVALVVLLIIGFYVGIFFIASYKKRSNAP